MLYNYLKKCTKCSQIKLHLDFYRDSRRRDGYRPWCKACTSIDSKTREHKYRKTRDSYRERSKTKASKHKRKYYEKNKTEILESNKSWRQSIKGRLAAYKRSAKSRKIGFKLSENEFLEFWKKPCYYCGEGIDTIGLDRLDSSLDYSLNNVVSCCEICNKMKMALDVGDFLNHVSKINKRLFGGNFYEVC